MKEVAGTEITVTKKPTVIKLDEQPPVINNNQQEIFSKAPGLLISQQQTPGQFNFSYRGLGNPQESEFIPVLQDRVPTRDRLDRLSNALLHAVAAKYQRDSGYPWRQQSCSTARSLPQQLTM